MLPSRSPRQCSLGSTAIKQGPGGHSWSAAAGQEIASSFSKSGFVVFRDIAVEAIAPSRVITIT
jgi:hypothetical protein